MPPRRRGAAVARTAGSARTTREGLQIPRGPRSSSQRAAATTTVDENVVPPVQEIAALVAMMANATAQLTQAVQAINQVTQSTPQETVITQSPTVGTQNTGLVDRVLDQFLKTHPPTFNGASGSIEADAWLRDIEKRLRGIKCPEERKVDMAIFQLREGADDWWESHRRHSFGPDAAISWAEFEKLFLEQYFPMADRSKLMNDLRKLEQGSKTVREYEVQFTRIVRFVPSVGQHEDQKIYHFLSGLKEDIRRSLSAVRCSTFRELVDRAIHAEIELNACEEKSAGKRKIVDTSAADSSQKKHHQSQQMQKSNNYPPCLHCGKWHSGACNLVIGKCFNCYSTEHKVKDCPHKVQDQSNSNVTRDSRYQHKGGWQQSNGGQHQKNYNRGHPGKNQFQYQQQSQQIPASQPYQQHHPHPQYQPQLHAAQHQQMMQYSSQQASTPAQPRSPVLPRVFTITQQEDRVAPDSTAGPSC